MTKKAYRYLLVPIALFASLESVTYLATQLEWITPSYLKNYSVYENKCTDRVHIVREADKLLEECWGVDAFGTKLGYQHHPRTTADRWARVVDGTTVFSGKYVGGNDLGFESRKNYKPNRSRQSPKKIIAVLGSNYSAEHYGDLNWPEMLQQRLKQSNSKAEVINLSLAGSGLGNSWAILKDLTKRKDLILDQIIWTATADHLNKTFVARHNKINQILLEGQLPSWNPADFPAEDFEGRSVDRQFATPQIIKDFGVPLNGHYYLSSREFDQFEKGNWRPPTRLYFSFAAYSWLLELRKKRDVHNPEEKSQLIADIRKMLGQFSKKTIVYVPSVENLDTTDASETKKLVRDFAQQVNADFKDSSSSFDSSKSGIDFYKDWYQKSPRRFANMIYELVR